MRELLSAAQVRSPGETAAPFISEQLQGEQGLVVFSRASLSLGGAFMQAGGLAAEEDSEFCRGTEPAARVAAVAMTRA